MAHENQDDGLIRRYLLGRLAEAELHQLEERMMSDNEFFDRVLLAEDEMVEEYVQGELPDSDRVAFEASFLSTPEGRQQVAYAKAFRKYVAAVKPTPLPDIPVLWWRRPVFVSYLAAAAIIVIAIAIVIPPIMRRSDLPKGLTALANAYRDQRPLEARISGFSYAPAAGTRGGEEKVDKAARNRAVRILQNADDEKPSSATHYGLGKLALTEKKFDEAIGHFEDALKDESNNAELRSDYGAALLEAAKVLRSKDEGRSLEGFAKSLEHLNIALRLQPSLPEALFNRALCHEYMFLQDEAEEDWRKYLEQDASSQWADEAREHLRTRQEQKEKTSRNTEMQDFVSAYDRRDDNQAWTIIGQNRAANGSRIENNLLDEYLEQTVRGNQKEGERNLLVLEYASGLEKSRAGDAYLSNITEYYRNTTITQKRALVRARQLMKTGQSSYAGFNPEKALNSYHRANEIFVREGDVLESASADYAIGYCHISQHRNELALPIFVKLAETCEVNKYNWLLALSLNATANARTSLRDFSNAIRDSTRALELSESIGDTDGVAKQLNQLANEYYSINSFDKSLELYARSLAMADLYALGPSHLWVNCFSVARVFNQKSLYAAAIDYQKQALQTALQGGRPQLICRSYTYLGLLYGNQHNYDEAALNIQHAIEIGESLSDQGARADTIAYSCLQLANVHKQAGDLNKALANYDQAIDLYRKLDSKYFDYLSRKGRVLCCIARGGCPALEQEMEKTLALFEGHRSQIQEESNRNAFFDAEQNIYDVAIDFEYSIKQDSRKAFAYSERCRARSLGDEIGAGMKLVNERRDPDIEFNAVSSPLEPHSVQKGLPENTQVLQYAVLKDKLLIWLLSRDQYHTAVSDITLASLEQKVRGYLRLISSQSDDTEPEASREAKELYDLLIQPVESALDSKMLLCIVPDKILNYLPFDALRSGSGEYFIEQHEFVLSPSSSIFIFCSNAAREKTNRGNERLLCVGNPLFDATEYPYLEDLPAAANEAETIAHYYNSQPPLLGPLATKQRVASEMEKTDVIHLALHCVPDELSPLRSKLILAKDRNAEGKDSADGELQAYEIYKLNLSRVRLVVLSACRTGVERYYGGEGMIGISRPFIAKGVPLVVSSLWSVDSKSTKDLMINFHKHRLEGSRTTAALRQAQLEMITGSDERHRSPYYWAAFVTIGGYAAF